MADTIGNISVPTIAPSGTFPLVTDFPHVQKVEPRIKTHLFSGANFKIEQRFLLGSGRRHWRAQWADLYDDDFDDLKNFWELRKGPYQPFTLDVPGDRDESPTSYTVCFEDEPLSWERFVDCIVRTGVGFVEIVSDADAPFYDVLATIEGVPGDAMQTEMEAQDQEWVPLVDITPKQSDYPVIHLSDRRCHIGAATTTSGQLYQARLITWGGISQRLGGDSDTATFLFGNADKVMRDLAADVDLFRADIQFSLYHVNTGIRWDIWKGEAIDFESSSLTEFSMRAVDGLYDLTNQYPFRKVTPDCWKLFKKPGECPYLTAGSGGDANECDRGYRTPKGCVSHGMKHYFGGFIAEPQSVRGLGDTTQGFFGTGRPTQTATSIVSDSMMDQPIIDIYTDIPMPQKALLIAGRDEGDFYEGIGVMCRGPITFGRGSIDSGGNRRLHRIDGQPNHGDPGTLGLREIVGNDPAGDTDFMSLDQSGDQTSSGPNLVFSGQSTYLDNFAAGVAALIIRRSDEKGFQITTLEEHDMQGVIGTGLEGHIWTAPGVCHRGVLSNPIWVALEVYLEGTRRNISDPADAALAEKYFDVDAAIAAAAICDIVTPKVIGDGDEVQFKFRGSLRDVKPLKDWLQEILNTCLGIFWFNNGKLVFGIREDAAAAHSFSEGNMLANSLKLHPLAPQFNRLTMTFANSDYEFVADSLPVKDLDHIAYLGRTLQNSMNLVGASGKSQAGRIGATRLKENLGGVGMTEWKKARVAEWQSTVLAGGVRVATGVSLDLDEMPGGTGLVRVTGWRLNPDYSIDFTGETITDSMYDGVAGPKAADVPANGVQVEFYPVPLRSAWCPDVEIPLGTDALFSVDDRTFGSYQSYELMQSGDKRAAVHLLGEAAVNRFVLNSQPPLIRGQRAIDSGGSLEGLTNYWVGVSAYIVVDGERHWSPPSNVRRFTFEDVTAAFNACELTAIDWPPGFTGGALFAGDDEKTMCWQRDIPMSDGYTWDGPLKQSTYNQPSPAHDFAIGKVKELIHGGTLAMDITEVTGHDIRVNGIATLGDDWTGRYVQIIADATDGSVPVLTFLVDSYIDATGTFTMHQDAEAAGVGAGDILLILLDPNIYTGPTIGDAKIVNGLYPNGALAEVDSALVANAEVGHIVRGITPGRPHQLRTIVSNDATTYTVDHSFDYKPTFFIVEAPDWIYQGESSKIPVHATGVQRDITVIADNFINKPILIGGFLEDRRGQETPEEFAVVRMGFLFGSTALGAFSVATFNIAVPVDLSVGTDVAPHYIVGINPGSTLAVDEELVPIYVEAKVKIPAQGQSILVDVVLEKADGSGDGTIFSSGRMLEIPDGSTDLVYQRHIEEGTVMVADDILKIDVHQVGIDAAGRVMTLKVVSRVRKITTA